MPLGEIYWVLLVQVSCNNCRRGCNLLQRLLPLTQAFAYTALAMYLDKVLSMGEHDEAPQPWYFFLTPSFWNLRRSGQVRYRLRGSIKFVKLMHKMLVILHRPTPDSDAGPKAHEAGPHPPASRGRRH